MICDVGFFRPDVLVVLPPISYVVLIVADFRVSEIDDPARGRCHSGRV